MFEKRVNKTDLKELKKRTDLINQYYSVVQALELQKQFYIRDILPKYGLDLNVNYSINLKTGRITKAKEKPQPQK